VNPGCNRYPEQVFTVSENVNRKVIGLEGYLMDRFGHNLFSVGILPVWGLRTAGRGHQTDAGYGFRSRLPPY